jgi:exodeoxyribonuclease VII large subunit
VTTTERDVISVAELGRRLRSAAEGATGQEWIEGEVTSIKRAASGHVYFTLKDVLEEAVIDCVIYRFAALRARRHLTEGSKVQLLGRATIWVPRGRLQLIAETVRPAGRGAQLEALEKLKEKLKALGLFERERKRPLPIAPHVVGVVTSLHGAAIHDIRTVSARRGRVILVISPAVVQGEGAPSSIVRALDLIDRDPRVQVTIVGRGGGSGEDLMAFNDERVVLRLAEMKKPTVSAVGHETDLTLTDLVADVRAATPSEAAELVVADDARNHARLVELEARLLRALRSRLEDDRGSAARLRVRLTDPRFLIAERQQYLDELNWRSERVISRLLARRRVELDQSLRRLAVAHPRAVLAAARGRLTPLGLRLSTGMSVSIERKRHALLSRMSRLESLSPLGVLARGYAIAITTGGKALRSAVEVTNGEPLKLRLHEGELRVTVDDGGRRGQT